MHDAVRAQHLAAVELRACSVRLGRHWALRDVTLTLGRGERWLLLGANGAGKTVLLKLLRGDLWPTPTGRESRRYVYTSGDVDEQPLDAAGHIAYLGPERHDRYDRYEYTLSVAQAVLTGYDDSDFPLQPATPGQRRRIRDVLRRVGLRGFSERRLLELSYGQRRRVLLARVLVRNPDVLLLDEAMNGLDASGRRSFLQALHRALPAGTTWVLASHRPADAREAGATHLARIAHGQLERAGPVAGALPLHGGLAGQPRAPAGDVHGPDRSQTRPLFALDNAAVYRNGRAVIGTFSWTLRRGEHWYLRGANGSGKSTLLAVVYGDLWPRHGGRLERRWPAAEDWKRRVGLVSPELQATYCTTGCTVRDIVTSGLHDSIGLNEAPTPAERRRVARELGRWGLGELAERRARELSYGQLRLVLAARAFLRPRWLYLFDEPFDGLDAHGRARLASRLGAAVRRGATLVIASHHEDDVPPYVQRQLTLRRGLAPISGLRAAAQPRRRSPHRR